MARKTSPRLFRFTDSKSDKFWEIELHRTSYVVRFGKWGSEGQKRSKSFEDNKTAKLSYAQVIEEKIKKGYREQAVSKKEANTTRKKSTKEQAITGLNGEPYSCFSDLPEATPLKIKGLFRPSGGGSMDMRKNTWTFSQNLLAWRVEDGPIVEDDAIVVCRNISNRKLSQLMKAIPDLGIIEFTAHRPKCTIKPKGYSEPIRFELDKLGSKCRDHGLAEIESRYIQPIIYKDRTFGTLTFNREFEQFECEIVKSRQHEMSISFSAKDVQELKVLIRLAIPLWKRKTEWINNWREFIADSMFDLAGNGWWIGEETLTRKKFLEYLGYPSLISFWLEDDEIGYTMTGSSEELFGDHNIDATGNTLYDFRNASISG